MPKKQSPQKTLAAMSGAAVPKPSAKQAPPDFIDKIIRHPDHKQAGEILLDYAGNSFDQNEGKTLPAMQRELTIASQKLDESEKQEKQLEKELVNTVRYKKSAPSKSDKSDQDTEKDIGFLDWKFGDRVTIIALGFSAILVMGIGGVNTYVALMASGEAVFLEQPWLAICLSFLPPAGSTAFKFIGQFFSTDTAIRRYTLSIYALSMLFLLSWSITFALTYTGVSGGIDLDAMLDGDGGTADHNLLFDRLRSNAKAPANSHSLGKEDTLEMIKLLGVVFNPDQSIFDKPLAAQVLSNAKMNNAHNVEIGVSWGCACDLDLYAQAFHGASILSYQNQSSSEGLHLKDLMSATKQDNAFETVRFFVPVDLSALKLAVHVYGGDVSNGVNGEIRIAIGNQVYAKNFTMTPTGSNKPNRNTIFTQNHHPFVTVFNPIEIVGAR